MEDLLIGLAKTCIKSVFTAQKYGNEILDEDLYRIVFIRNLIEESVGYVKTNCKELNVAEYNKELKEYALELYVIQCLEAFSEKEKEDEDFDIEDEKAEIETYFDYIYSNLEYPE